MKTIGVRELKNQLSLYLQYVKEGEKVIITEHNKIIAEITIPEAATTKVPFEEKLKQLSKDDNILPAKRNISCVKLPKITEKLDWAAAYNDIRADRI